MTNDSWAQSGGNAHKSVGHVALGQSLGVAWTVVDRQGQRQGRPAGRRTGRRRRQGLHHGHDRARSARSTPTTARQLWSARFGEVGDNAASIYGGGVAYDGGRVYATNGIGYVAALDATNGAAVWTVKPGGPLRGEPSVDGGSVYVMSQDNQIYSLKAADGSTNWSNAAALEIAGVFGAAAPSIGQGTVVAGFSSRRAQRLSLRERPPGVAGRAGADLMTTSVASLSDIDADAVIDGGVVYAVGQGGRMVALDLFSGQRIWELNFGGIATPWVAGDWLFAVNDKAQLIAVAARTGKIRWINQLPRYRDR